MGKKGIQNLDHSMPCVCFCVFLCATFERSISALPSAALRSYLVCVCVYTQWLFVLSASHINLTGGYIIEVQSYLWSYLLLFTP